MQTAYRYAMPSTSKRLASFVPMNLNPVNGSIQLGNLPNLICPTLSLDEARIAFATLMHGERDVGTGDRKSVV